MAQVRELEASGQAHSARVAAPDRSRRWAALLLGLYAALMATVMLVPRPVDEGVIPFVRSILAVSRRRGLPEWVGYDVLELASHAALFMPLGILASVALGRRLLWLAVLAVLVVAAVVELTQALLLAGHPVSVLDLVMNVAGAVVGCVIGFWISQARRRKQLQ